jgi:hypothetical protein
MNTKYITSILVFGIGFSITPSAFARASGMPKSPEECKQPAGKPGVNGYMPRGVTDSNLEEYQNPSRCEANNGRPIDSDACKKGMQRLYEVASELNQMVKKNCEEFIPKFTSDPEVMKCIASKTNKSQTGCTSGALKTLSEVNPVIRQFKATLNKYYEVLGDLQKQGIQVYIEVVQVMDESKSAQGSGAYTSPNANAQKIGFSTLAETQKFHSGQDPLIAKALLAEFQSRFEKSEEQYADANPSNYSQKVQPIDESWKKLGTMQSRMLREHMQSYLNAEELKLATKMYENQLQEVDAQITKQAAINEQTIHQMGAADPAMMNLIPGSPAQSSAEGNSSSIGEISDSNSYALKSGSGKSAAQGKNYASIDTLKDSDLLTEEKKSAANSGGRSNLSLKSNSKEALRKKLEAMKKSGHSIAGPASEFAASEDASEKMETKLDAERNLASLEPISAGKRDQVLAEFNGEDLLDTGFQMHGEDTDNSVQAIVDGFYSALGDQQLQNADIGSADDVSLFMRVKEFHGKCLKLGCVTGAKTR